jgi:hypothetical protein
VFESRGHLSIMSQTLSKRGREPEALAHSNDVREAKRFQGEETDWFLDLLQLEQSVALCFFTVIKLYVLFLFIYN